MLLIAPWLNRFPFCSTTGGGKLDEGDKTEEGEDTAVMNNLMQDIQAGFIQRRLPDGGFKVGTAFYCIQHGNNGNSKKMFRAVYCFDLCFSTLVISKPATCLTH